METLDGIKYLTSKTANHIHISVKRQVRDYTCCHFFLSITRIGSNMSKSSVITFP